MSSTNGFPTQVPNPFTPMAYLPPEIARQTTVASYIIVGTLAILVWDIINNIIDDGKLLFKYRVRLPTIAYFISRAASLGYVLWSAIYYTAPTGHCVTYEKGLDALYPVAVSTSSLLFFFRARAVFDRNYYAISFFFFLWLAVVAGTSTVAFGVTGVNIGPTEYCLNSSIKPYVAAAPIIPLVHDTCVFLAISWRLMMNSHVNPGIKNNMRVALFGDYLPAFSKALLQDGQKYYLVTVFSNLLTVIMIYVTSVPVTYRTIFSAPNVMLINVMTCRVFRKAKFGIFRESSISTSRIMNAGGAGVMNSGGGGIMNSRGGGGVINSRGGGHHHTIIPLSFRRETPSTRSDTLGGGVEIVKTVEHSRDHDLSDFHRKTVELSGDHDRDHDDDFLNHSGDHGSICREDLENGLGSEEKV